MSPSHYIFTADNINPVKMNLCIRCEASSRYLHNISFHNRTHRGSFMLKSSAASVIALPFNSFSVLQACLDSDPTFLLSVTLAAFVRQRT